MRARSLERLFEKGGFTQIGPICPLCIERGRLREVPLRISFSPLQAAKQRPGGGRVSARPVDSESRQQFLCTEVTEFVEQQVNFGMGQVRCERAGDAHAAQPSTERGFHPGGRILKGKALIRG